MNRPTPGGGAGTGALDTCRPAGRGVGVDLPLTPETGLTESGAGGIAGETGTLR